MRNFVVGVVVAMASVCGCLAQTPEQRAAWRAWLGKDATRPTAEELPRRIDTLLPLLDSPDPELRDDIAFSLLAKWLVRDRIVPVERRRALLDTWIGKLRVEASAAPDAVVGRSFAALCLSLLVALDNQEPWLTDAEFDRVLAAAVDYLRAEGDVRGFDARLGWVHSVAHTADLLKFLARSAHLRPAGQASLLDAIRDKLARTDVPLVSGEDERLARAVVSLAAREDFAAEAFAAWLAAVWPAAASGEPSAAALAHEHNRRHLVTTLHGLLTADRRDLDNLQRARELVTAHLRLRWR